MTHCGCGLVSGRSLIFSVFCFVMRNSFYHFFLFNYFFSPDISFQIWFKKEMCHQSFKKKISWWKIQIILHFQSMLIFKIIEIENSFALNCYFSLSLDEHELMNRWAVCNCANSGANLFKNAQNVIGIPIRDHCVYFQQWMIGFLIRRKDIYFEKCARTRAIMQAWISPQRSGLSPYSFMVSTIWSTAPFDRLFCLSGLITAIIIVVRQCHHHYYTIIIQQWIICFSFE